MSKDKETAKTGVDSYWCLDRPTAQVVRAWIAREQPVEIPWTPLSKPLSECKVALVSSAGISLRSDTPFDSQGERENPWWGDPSYRVIPVEATTAELQIDHLHINASYPEQDINCVLPLQRLAELEAAGEIGAVAASHYSFMGYILRPEQLLQESVPKIAEQLVSEEVDVALLVPV